MHGGNEKREIEAEGVGVCVKGVSKQEQERERGRGIKRYVETLCQSKMFPLTSFLCFFV